MSDNTLFNIFKIKSSVSNRDLGHSKNNYTRSAYSSRRIDSRSMFKPLPIKLTELNYQYALSSTPSTSAKSPQCSHPLSYKGSFQDCSKRLMLSDHQYSKETLYSEFSDRIPLTPNILSLDLIDKPSLLLDIFRTPKNKIKSNLRNGYVIDKFRHEKMRRTKNICVLRPTYKSNYKKNRPLVPENLMLKMNKKLDDYELWIHYKKTVINSIQPANKERYMNSVDQKNSKNNL